MLHNLLDHYINASEGQLTHGFTWYKKANRICVKLSIKHDLPLYKVVGILSALSPRNKWERNIIDCESVIVHGIKASVCTFNANKEKAVRILRASTPTEVFDELNGRKVQSFYNNILKPKKVSTVTVDVHAMRSVGLNRAPNKTLYNQVEDAYKSLGTLLGILPHEAQAIVWAVVRDGKIMGV